jgi:hypothetical protein
MLSLAILCFKDFSSVEDFDVPLLVYSTAAEMQQTILPKKIINYISSLCLPGSQKYILIMS